MPKLEAIGVLYCEFKSVLNRTKGWTASGAVSKREALQKRERREKSMNERNARKYKQRNVTRNTSPQMGEHKCGHIFMKSQDGSEVKRLGVKLVVFGFDKFMTTRIP